MSLSETRVLVIHPDLKKLQNDKNDVNSSLAEAVSLAKSLNLNVIKQQLIKISTPRAGYLFGKGATESIFLVVKNLGIDLVIINGDISPIQQRNLEKIWQIKLIDRTHLILEIFSDRAATREGVLQVELATLSYQRTRLVRSWTHLERQRGGLGFVGGPGETQIESDRRAINNAILKIKSQLSKVVSTRSLHRRSREKKPYPIVALIGYTNAGKSTLVNQLLGEERVLVSPESGTTRDSIEVPLKESSKEITLIDTAGMRRKRSIKEETEKFSVSKSVESIKKANVVILLLDSSEDIVDQDIHLLGLTLTIGRPVVIAANKLDILSKERKVEL